MKLCFWTHPRQHTLKVERECFYLLLSSGVSLAKIHANTRSIHVVVYHQKRCQQHLWNNVVTHKEAVDCFVLMKRLDLMLRPEQWLLPFCVSWLWSSCCHHGERHRHTGPVQQTMRDHQRRRTDMKKLQNDPKKHYLGYTGQNDETQSSTVESVFIWKHNNKYFRIHFLWFKKITYKGSVLKSSEMPM